MVELTRINPTEKAVTMFIEIKRRLDNLEKQRANDVKELKKKLRARSREVPETILELGLVPTLSFCLAKAGKEGLSKAIVLIEEGQDVLDGVKPEELAYGIYTYVILTNLNEALNIKLNSREVKNGKTRSVYEYLNNLLREDRSIVASMLLQPYLAQFKRLCEAEFPPEREGLR